MVRLKVWHHRKKKIDRNPPYQPAEKKASLGNSTQKRWWSSIPSAFSLCVEQYLLILWSSIPWTLWSSIPNQFQKGLGHTVVKQWSNSRFLRELHKGCTVGAQGAHSGRTVHVFPNFFAFQAREMKCGEQNCMIISESFLFISFWKNKMRTHCTQRTFLPTFLFV